MVVVVTWENLGGCSVVVGGYTGYSKLGGNRVFWKLLTSDRKDDSLMVLLRVASSSSC